MLKSKYTTSNGSRKRKILASTWHYQSFRSTLNYRKISHAGRSLNTGKIIIYSKGSIKKRLKLINIRYITRTFTPVILASITFVPLVTKLVNLLILDSGAYFYFPSAVKSRIFTFTSAYRFSVSHVNAFFWHFHSFIFKLKTFKKISNLELIPNRGIQYARSAGSYAKMLTINFVLHTALIRLPSGVKKQFSIYGIGLSGPSSLSLKKKIRNRQSGFFRCLGFKAKVRGVAKNPVDHPHGGRTKSIKYPRTPWGKTTKFK